VQALLLLLLLPNSCSLSFPCYSTATSLKPSLPLTYLNCVLARVRVCVLSVNIVILSFVRRFCFSLFSSLPTTSRLTYMYIYVLQRLESTALSV
jgi:hypothetical protein